MNDVHSTSCPFCTWQVSIDGPDSLNTCLDKRDAHLEERHHEHVVKEPA